MRYACAWVFLTPNDGGHDLNRHRHNSASEYLLTTYHKRFIEFSRSIFLRLLNSMDKDDFHLGIRRNVFSVR